MADDFYKSLQDMGVEVLYDDREGVRAGEMFADADLFGVPIRVVISPRNLKENAVEISTRDKSVKEMVALGEAKDYVLNLKKKLEDEINSKVEARAIVEE